MYYCIYCGDRIEQDDHGTWIDSSGGDVCGIHSVDDDVPPNTNQPHIPDLTIN